MFNLQAIAKMFDYLHLEGGTPAFGQSGLRFSRCDEDFQSLTEGIFAKFIERRRGPRTLK